MSNCFEKIDQRKFKFLIVMGILILCGSEMLAVTNCPIVTTASDSPKIDNVAVTITSAQSVTIRWETNIPSDSLAFWSGRTEDYIAYGHRSQVTDAAGTTKHAITITGLTPKTDYWFGVRSRTVKNGVVNASKAGFWECNQTENKFSTQAAPSSGPLDFTARVSGVHRVFQGFETYLDTHAALISGTARFKDQGYRISVKDLPPNTEVRWVLKDILNDGLQTTTYRSGDTLNLWSLVTSPIELITNSGGVTPTGNYVLKIVFSAESKDGQILQKVIPWPLRIEPAIPLKTSKPSTYPDIPRLSTWKSNMTIYGEKWCTQTGAPYDQFVWFYDGIHVYQQIREFTKQSSTWSPCIESLIRDYRDGYVLKNNGGIQKYMMFARGLYLDFLAKRSNDSKRAIVLMSGQAGASVHGFSIPFMREQAFALEVWRYSEKLGAASPWLKPDVANLVGMAEQVAEGEATSYQPYMCGLLAQALIEYYEDGHGDDIRIPIAIKAMADRLYDRDFNRLPSQPGAFVYSSFRFQLGLTDEKDGSELRGLNLLIAPMYAWLFKYTGEQKYQIEGDRIWSAAFDAKPGDTVGWTGKNFSQNYRWSFDYVKWRSGQ